MFVKIRFLLELANQLVYHLYHYAKERTRMKSTTGLGEKWCKMCMKRQATLVANHPVAVVLLTSALTVAMTVVGYMRFAYDLDFMGIATMTNNRAVDDRNRIEAFFPEDPRHFSLERMTRLRNLCIVIAKPKDDGVVTRKQYLDEVKRMDREIYNNLTVSYRGANYTYKDICAWNRRNECFSGGIKDISGNSLYPAWIDRKGWFVRTAEFFSKPRKCKVMNMCRVEGSTAARLMYYPSVHDSQSEVIANLWQKKLIEYTSKNFTYVEMRHLTPRSLLGEFIYIIWHAKDKLLFAAIGIPVFAVLSGWSTNCVRVQPFMVCAMLASLLMPFVTTCGIMLLAGYPLVPQNILVVLLLAVRALNNIFLMLNAWNQTRLSDPVAKRMRRVYAKVAVPMLMTSLVNATALYLSHTVPHVIFKSFSLYAGTSILVFHFYELTLVGAIIALFGEREGRNMHGWLPRVEVKPKSMRSSKSALVRVFLTGGVNYDEPDQPMDRDVSPVKRKFTKITLKLISSKYSFAVILLVYVAYLVVAVYGSTKVITGYDIKNILGHNSTVKRYYDWETKYFRDYAYVVSVMITGDVDYSRKETQEQTDEVASMFMRSEYGISNRIGGFVFWLTPFLSHLSAYQRKYGDPERLTPERFVEILKNDFLPKTQYVDDVAFDESGRKIVATRFHFSVKNVRTSADDYRMMQDLRNVSDSNGRFNLTVNSATFSLFDRDLAVISISRCCVMISIVAACVLYLALLFDISTFLTVAFCVASVQIGVVGCMSLLGVNLDPIIAFMLALACGVAVEYCGVMSHHCSRLKSRESVMKKMLDQTGWPMFQSSAAMALIAGPLYLVPNNFIRTISIIMLLAVGFSLFHAIAVVPTLFRLTARRASTAAFSVEHESNRPPVDVQDKLLLS